MCVSARALIKLDKLELAESRVKTASKLYPDFPKPHEILGQINARKGENEQAVKAFATAITLDPTSPDTHMKLGMALMRLGRIEEASKAIDESKRLNPNRELISKAAEFERDGDIASAEKIYRKILRRDPDNVEALRLLAVVALSKYQYRDAEVLLQRAVDCAPEFIRARADLISVQLERDRFDEGLKNAELLLRFDSQQAESHLLLASAFASAGRHADSIATYEKALDLMPGHSGALTGLGNMLKTVGRHGQAVDAYKACIAANPDYAEAYWSLANLKTFRFADDEVTRMKDLLEKDHLSADSQAQLCNALGLEYESRKEYEKAISFFDRGNKVRRQSESYDPVATEEFNDRSIGVFDSNFISQHSSSGDLDGAPIFIVGLPRSGSTLIEQILASHSQVEGTHELSDLGRLSQSTLQNFNELEQFPDVLRKIEVEKFAEFGKRYISRTRKYRAGKAYFIDKNPNNFVYIGFLKLILPNAKIIDARRHPIDSCLGSYKQLFARGQPFTYDMMELGEYYLQYSRLMNHWHEVLPGFVLEVRYEDVVSNLDIEVRRILNFCNLPWEESCLRFHETDRAVKTASSEQVRQPIYSSSVNLWRNYEKHLDELIEVLQPELQKLPESDRPG
ncbi:MAG: sulfotransferase [Woeseia sp.]|nr:sulfotransferase [Woeseia sp.]|tara:strand:+ start:700 stop:2574 length:1875 start_codon:yes stop_codon:yes gene_type:complete